MRKIRRATPGLATRAILLSVTVLLIVACSDRAADTPSPAGPVTASPTAERQSTPTTEVALTPSRAAEAAAIQATPTRVDIEAWREDLAFFKEALIRIHPNPFYRVPEAEYDQALGQLLADLPAMSDEQIIVTLARVVAFIDGHSAIRVFEEPAGFHLYPLQLYEFSDGLYVIAAREPYEGTVGGKVVQIGALPVDEALAAIGPYVPHDNMMTVKLARPSWLVRPELLLALGIIETVESPEYVVEMADGTRQTISPQPVSLEENRLWIDGSIVGLTQQPEPLYLSRRNEPYWFTYLEDSGTLYIQYNQVRAGTSALANEIRDFLDQQEVERVVLDVRHNPGGNNTTYSAFLNLLSTDSRINQPGRFFTIIGRNTFSAAANFTTELENRSHTIFVGEPMGGSPNLYGDVVPVTLPNSELTINISARYWEISTPDDDRESIEPDLPAPLSSRAYFAGRDPALEAILAFDPAAGYRPAANPILAPLASETGWEAADVRDPYVVEVDGTYYMFYAGQDTAGTPAIGYATSENGRKWFRSGANPVLTASGAGFDSHGVAAPVVTVEDGFWTLYYGAIGEPGGRTSAIGRATATDPGGEWTRAESPLLVTGEAPAWDSLSIAPGSVLSVDGEWRLYYSGFAAGGQIGVGMATSVDGVEWTKFNDPATTTAAFAAGDPLLPGSEPGAWDEIVWAPFVHVHDGRWELVYHGDPFSSRENLKIGLGLATSDDGLEWMRPDAPFLTLMDGNRFPHTPSLLSVGDFLYVYYASVETGGTGGQIELLIMPHG